VNISLQLPQIKISGLPVKKEIKGGVFIQNLFQQVSADVLSLRKKEGAPLLCLVSCDTPANCAIN